MVLALGLLSIQISVGGSLPEPYLFRLWGRSAVMYCGFQYCRVALQLVFRVDAHARGSGFGASRSSQGHGCM